jgi:DNA-binding SARP family transcriptional activator/tetratricopeptide (TPR) repeat protein
VRFGLLGPVQAWAGDREIDLGPPQQRGVAAALLLEPGHIVTVSRLEELLWGQDRPRTATKNVQVSVHHLRRALVGLPDVSVLTRGSGYLIEVNPEDVDLHRFRRLVREAGQAMDETAAQLLRQADGLWRGPALDGASQRVMLSLGPRLEEERLSALEARLAVELRLGRDRDCVTELASLVRDYPVREELRALLMLALWRTGRRAEALAAFRAGRALLRDELGIEPGSRLQELHQLILRGESGPAAERPGTRDDAASDQPTAKPRDTGQVIPAELPRNVSDFVGRGGELAELDALLAAWSNPGAAAVVCVDGMAGVGKSALVVHWAHRARDRFPAGTLFLDLRGHDPYQAPMSSAEGLTELLRSLGTASRGLPTDTAALARLYRTALVDERRLLVLDNASSAEQVRPLLPGTPACMTLVTSRSRLTGLVATSEAHRIGLGPLPEQDAVSLLRLAIGAEQVRTQPDCLTELAALCGHLPLALRIAGANSAAHADRDLREMIEELGTSRLTSLQVDGDRELAVRRAFDLTCDTLPAPAVRLVDREAADRWLEHERRNLLSVHYAARRDPTPSAWRLALELRGFLRLRRYGNDWLATATAAASIAEQLGDPQAQGACVHSLGHAHWSLGEYDVALKQFERALGHSRECEWAEGVTGALSALGAVHHEIGHHEEAISYYRQALTRAEGPATTELRIITQGSLGLVYQSVGRLREAADCFQAVLDLIGGEAEERADIVATSLGNLGMTRADLGDLAQARDLMSRALALYRQVGSRNGEANVLAGLAGVDAECGRYDEATYQSTLALRIARDLGDRRIECDALVAMALSSRLRGEPQAARARLTEAIGIAERIGYGRGVPDAVCLLAAVELDLDDLPGATASCDRALTLARAAGHRPTEARALHVAAQVSLAGGRYDAALRDARTAETISRELGLKLVEARVLCTLSQILMVTDSRAAKATARHAADLLTVTGAAVGPAPHGPRR